MSPFKAMGYRERAALLRGIDRNTDHGSAAAFLTVIGVGMCVLAGTVAALELAGPGR